MKKRRLGIEERLSLLKSRINKALNPDELENEDMEEVETEEIIEDDEEELEVEDEDVEASEDDEEIIEDDEETEAVEEPEEEIEEENELEVEYDYDELTDKLNVDLGINGINERMDNIEISVSEINNQLSEIVGLLEGSTNVVADMAAEKEAVSKSISKIQRNLDKVMKTRKSLKNVNIYEKFDEKKVMDIDKLSKSQKANILASELEAGNKLITAKDVSSAEISGYLSENARMVIQRAVKK